MEGKCSGNGAKGSGHARVGVGMTRRGDVEAREPGLRVGAGGDGPRLERSPSDGRDVGTRVMVFPGLEVKAGVL